MPRKPSADTALARFGARLAQHLDNGTCPGTTSGEPWTHKAFADKIPSERTDAVVSPRSVSNWCNGRLPTRIEPILDALFGRNDTGVERAALHKLFRDARKDKAIADIKRAKPRLWGATWVTRGQQLVMESAPRRTDAWAAADLLQQQLQGEIRDMATRLAKVTSQRSSNELLIRKVSATVTSFASLLDCYPKQLPDLLPRLYRHSLVLGDLLDVDTAVHADNSDAPLDSNIRGDLSALVRIAAPWLRGFPSLRVLDDRAGKLLFQVNLIAPALGLIQSAQEHHAITAENGSDLVQLLIAG